MAAGNLNQVKGLTDDAIELLSAVGVEGLSSLAQSEAFALQEEIFNANKHLGLGKKVPVEDDVIAWIKEARGIVGEETIIVPEPTREPSLKVTPLPIAIAVKKEQIVGNKIAVSDVPVMEEFVEVSAKEVEVKQEANFASKVHSPVDHKGEVKRKKKSVQKKRRSTRKRTEVPVEESKTIRESALGGIPPQKSDPLALSSSSKKLEDRPVVEPLKRNAGFDIRKTASPELNEGRKLHSRRYVRGVLHPQPRRVKLAALVSFISFLLFPASIVAAVMVIARDSLPIEEPLWLLMVPVAFLFFGFLYLTIAKPLKCRICGQPLLSRKACFKHVKAHRMPLLGYIFPTSMHMLLFHWFRCIYCGTSVRLKE